jgi:hypothetical protein
MAFSFANLLAASVKRGVLISVMKHLDKTFRSYRQRCSDLSDRFSQLLKKPSISLVGIKRSCEDVHCGEHRSLVNSWLDVISLGGYFTFAFACYGGPSRGRKHVEILLNDSTFRSILLRDS